MDGLLHFCHPRLTTGRGRSRPHPTGRMRPECTSRDRRARSRVRDLDLVWRRLANARYTVVGFRAVIEGDARRGRLTRTAPAGARVRAHDRERVAETRGDDRCGTARFGSRRPRRPVRYRTDATPPARLAELVGRPGLRGPPSTRGGRPTAYRRSPAAVIATGAVAPVVPGPRMGQGAGRVSGSQTRFSVVRTIGRRGFVSDSERRRRPTLGRRGAAGPNACRRVMSRARVLTRRFVRGATGTVAAVSGYTKKNRGTWTTWRRPPCGAAAGHADDPRLRRRHRRALGARSRPIRSRSCRSAWSPATGSPARCRR